MLEMSYSFTIYGLASNCREVCGQLLRYRNLLRIYEVVDADNDKILRLTQNVPEIEVKQNSSRNVPRIGVRLMGLMTRKVAKVFILHQRTGVVVTKMLTSDTMFKACDQYDPSISGVVPEIEVRQFNKSSLNKRYNEDCIL